MCQSATNLPVHVKSYGLPKSKFTELLDITLVALKGVITRAMEGSLIGSTQLNTAGSHMKHKLFLKPVANCEDIYPSNNARCNLHLLRLHTRSPINAPSPPLKASFSLLDSYYTAAYSWPEQPFKICSWVCEWEFSDVARNDTAVYTQKRRWLQNQVKLIKQYC